MKRILALALLLASPSWGAQNRARVPKIPRLHLPPAAAAFKPVEIPRLPSAVLRIEIPQLEIPQFKLPDAAKAVPVAKALPRLTIMGQASMGAADKPAMQVWGKGGEEWDQRERREEAREEELVYVNREAKKEAVLYQHAQRPALDQQRFSEARAKEFAAESFDLGAPEDKTTTGQEILSWLTTEHAVMEGRAPESDFESFGRSELQVREIAKDKGVIVHALQRAMDRAFRYGLVYRLYDLKESKTYYGVPYEARAALGLAAPEAAARAEAAKQAPESPFAKSLAALAGDALSLPRSGKYENELFEFAAQAVKSAQDAGIVKEADLPAEFRERSKALGFDTPDLRSGLLTLLESSHGTAWFAQAKALCVQAVAQGLLSQKELDQSLENL